MAKYTPSSISSGYQSTTQLNNNFTNIASELNNKVLYRNNPSGEPNSMQNDLDMNGNNILNLPAPATATEPVRLGDLPSGTATNTATLTSLLDSKNLYTANNVEAALEELAFQSKDKVNTIALLRTRNLTGHSSGDTVYVKSHTTLGDGGQGVFRYITGAAPGTYTDNNGTIILPTGGNGSAAWLRNYSEGANVRHFGAQGDGVTNDYTAFSNAIAFCRSAYAYSGHTLHIPAGYYKLDSELEFSLLGVKNNIIVQGEGTENTVLDFAGAPAASNGISFGTGLYFAIRDLSIFNAPYDGVYIGKGNDGSHYTSSYDINNLHIKSCGRYGMHFSYTYMGTISRVFVENCTSDGFRFDGYHTSLNFRGCESGGNGGNGWTINSIVYSNFDTCGSDDNAFYGYYLTNCRGIKFSSCGTESNQRDGYFLETSTAIATGVPSAAQDIRGVVFEGCFNFNNSLLSPGTYATVLRAATANSRGIDFVMIGGSATPGSASDLALILQGTSGTINATQVGTYYDSFSVADSITGTSYLIKAPTTGGLLSSHPTSGLGYTTGAGGSVTQATSKATAVTLNKICGKITTDAASLAANAFVSFSLNNTTIAITDTVEVNLVSGMAGYGTYLVTVEQVGANYAQIGIRNMTAGALAEALVINFTIHKSATA